MQTAIAVARLGDWKLWGTAPNPLQGLPHVPTEVQNTGDLGHSE